MHKISKNLHKSSLVARRPKDVGGGNVRTAVQDNERRARVGAVVKSHVVIAAVRVRLDVEILQCICLTTENGKCGAAGGSGLRFVYFDSRVLLDL